jgi:transposase
MSQKQIAIALGRSVRVVQKWQKIFGCHAAGRRPLTPQAEAEVVALLLQNVGQARIARLTGIGNRRIRELMRKHGIVHKTGGVSTLTREKEAEIVERIQKRADYCETIARELGVPVGHVHRIAHEIWGDAHFIGGPLWPPLQSHFPQRPVQEALAKHAATYTSVFDPPQPLGVISSDDAISLINLVLRTSFNGTMPDNFVAFAEILAEQWTEHVPRKFWASLTAPDRSLLRHTVAIELLQAANTVRTLETAHRNDMVN